MDGDLTASLFTFASAANRVTNMGAIPPTQARCNNIPILEHFNMIIRIKIDGFKSLLNTELYLGPFTCIAGANAIGKSNFFDALMFLSKLADHTLVEAAKSIRSENLKHSEVKDIFYKSGSRFYPKLYFEVDIQRSP